MSALDQKDVISFMNAKQPNGKCEACGGTLFDVLDEHSIDQKGEHGRVVLTMFPFPGNDLQKGKSMDVVVVSCNTCSTLRFLNRKAVAEWIASNPTPNKTH
jgi:hypothetical protein